MIDLPAVAHPTRQAARDAGPCPRTARYVLIGLAVAAIVLMGLLVRPFASALLFAAVLGSVFAPLQGRLSATLGGRRQLAALLLTVGVTLVVVFPISTAGLMLGKQAVAGVDYVKDTIRSEGVQGLIADLPPGLRSPAKRLVGELPGGEAQLKEIAEGQSGNAAAAVGSVLVATSGMLFQTVAMLIAFYFLLVDGRRLLDWIAEATPLRPSQTRELISDFHKVSRAVFVSSFATAGAQSLVALIGFLLAGAPQPLFFTMLTFFAAFVPAVGAGLVPVGVALLLLTGGHPSSALFLAAWGLAVVGLTDNLVKPMLMKGRLEVHGAVIFFALLGGFAAFGPVGLVAGPLSVAFFLAMVRMCRRDLRPVEG